MPVSPMPRVTAVSCSLTLAAVLLAACGGGGGGGSDPPVNVRPPLPQLVQDVLPAGERIDVAADDFFAVAAGDRATFRAYNNFGSPIEVLRELVAGPDAQGRYTIRESVPANPSISVNQESWQKTAQGLVALDYFGEGAPAGFKALVGDVLIFPTPFYPVGSARTLLRQGSLGADLDGDGRPESFRFELQQEFVAFDTGTRGGRSERRARFRHRIRLTIEPSRADLLPVFSEVSQDMVFAAHTGLIQDLRTTMTPGTFPLDYNGLAGPLAGTLGGHGIDQAWNAGTTRYLTLRHHDLAFEPVHGYYYAGTSATDGFAPGAVVRIDPATGAMLASEALGNDVRSIAVSADGSTLYAGVFQRAEIVRLALPGLQVLGRIPIDSGTWAFSLAVSPQDAGTLGFHADGGTLRMLRNGVLQPRTPGTFEVQATLTDNPAMFAPDGASLFMFGSSVAPGAFGSGLLSVPALADGFDNHPRLAAETVFGRSLSMSPAGLVAGTSLYRVADLARLGGTNEDGLSGCRALNGTPRWVCGVSGQFRIGVVDAASFALTPDGRVPLGPPPQSLYGASVVRVVPGPHGQVAVMIGGEAAWYGDWVALFESPDLN